jgi:Tol biopolymer transport system component
MAGALDVKGALLFPRGNALVSVDFQNRNPTKIVEFPRTASLSSPSKSPDGQRIVVSVYVASTDPKDTLGGADLYVVDLADNTPQVLVPHGAPGVWLNEPSWSPDGQTLYYTKRAAIMENNRYRGEEVSIRRINLDGSGDEQVLAGASSPSISADGRSIAYLSPMGGTDPARLWVATVDGQQPRQLTDTTFTQIGTPRFAPQGNRLVFTAVGGPAGTPARPVSQRYPLDGLLAPSIAEAHGIPWDLWMVNLDGSGLSRLTDVGEDSPVPAWSPDGSAIAFSGEMGLYLVQLSTGETSMVAQEPASGIVWVPIA